MPALDLSRADFSGGDLRNINLSQCNLQGALMNACNLQGANLSGCNAVQASFRDVSIFADCNLCDTDLTGANFTGTVHCYKNKYNLKTKCAGARFVDIEHISRRMACFVAGAQAELQTADPHRHARNCMSGDSDELKESYCCCHENE